MAELTIPILDGEGNLWQIAFEDVNGDETKMSSAVTVRNNVAVNGSIANDGAAAAVYPLLVGGYASAAAPSSVGADNDAVRAWFLRNGAQATVLTAAGALIGGDASNGLDVDVTRLPALPAGTNNIGDVDVLTLPGIAGTVAHDSADSGNPVKIGGIARQANPTAVAALDRVDAMFDDIGRQVVAIGQVRDLMVHQLATITNSTSETTILTAAANTFHDLTMLVITNASATAVSVTIKDATGGTNRLIVDLAANGGAVIPFHRPLTQSAVNGNWTATLSVNTVTVHFTTQAEKNV